MITMTVSATMQAISAIAMSVALIRGTVLAPPLDLRPEQDDGDGDERHVGHVRLHGGSFREAEGGEGDAGPPSLYGFSWPG